MTLGKTDPYWKNPRVPAIFNNLIAWKCGHNGAITERTGHVIFNNFKIADSGIAGSRTTWGFIGPRTEGMTVTGTSFYNFDF